MTTPEFVMSIVLAILVGIAGGFIALAAQPKPDVQPIKPPVKAYLPMPGAYIDAAAPRKPDVQPIKPPVKADDEEKLAKVKAVLAAGIQERNTIIRKLKADGDADSMRRVKELLRVKPFLPSLETFKVGEVGLLFSARVIVSVTHVIDGQQMIIEYDPWQRKVALLKGFSTRGLADDDDIVRPEALLEVTGTKQLKMANGATRTVIVLEPFGIDHNIDARKVGKEKSQPKIGPNAERKPK